MQSLLKPAFDEASLDDEGSIYFHVVSHSHDDVGWISTPEEYFQDRVNRILNSVVRSLLENKSRKFS